MHTCAEGESDAPQELVAGQAVVIPDSQFEGSVRQLLQGHVFVDNRVTPRGVHRSFRNLCFSLRGTVLVRKKVAEEE